MNTSVLPSRAEFIKSPASTPIDSPILGPVSEAGRSRRRRGTGNTPDPNEALKDAERIWNEVLGSALDYCTNFFQTMMTPTPPNAISLLTMIRMNDKLIATAEARGTIPLTTYLQGWRLQLWPAFSKAMDAHIESVKSLGDSAEAKGLAGYMSKGVKDGAVRAVAVKYASLVASAVALADDASESMIFTRWVHSELC